MVEIWNIGQTGLKMSGGVVEHFLGMIHDGEQGEGGFNHHAAILDGFSAHIIGLSHNDFNLHH